MTGLFANLQSLHFLRPLWLLALALLPLLAWAWRRRRVQRSAWRQAVDPHLLQHLLEQPSTQSARRAGWLAMAGALLAIAALAGPSWQRNPQPLWQARAPLVVALDLSGAMLAGDLPPSRLAQARSKLATLLHEREGGEVGLLAFAGDAYVVAPLTVDTANVALFLDALSPSIMPDDVAQPSDARAAIERGVQLLRQAGFDHGDILLLSDHASAAAQAAAKVAAADGYRVSALGLGTAAGAPWRDAAGGIAHASLDAPSLRALANAGGGGYVALAPGTEDLARLGVLDPAARGAIAKRGSAASAWRDQGYWLLLPLLLLVPFAFRRNGPLALLAVCLCLPWQPARATGIDWWQRADQLAHARMQQGADAYHGKEYSMAERTWQGLPGADAAYNRGNALARQGRYPEALAAYDQALRLQPGMQDAIANRKAVEAAMKRKPSAGSKPGKGKGEGDGKAQPGRDGQPDAGDKAAGEQATGEHAAGEQDAADAAQHALMQQALRKARGSEAEPAAQAQKPETAEQRERRLANQAWLRRVPDDPGGLLRERFRLEQQRRRQEGE